MAKVRSTNTKPEIRVRKILYALGYRFRLHRKDLPGKPDIVLPAYKSAIFVHGCFWHRHKGCRDASIPKTGKPFWLKKFDDNVTRDKVNVRALRKLGWKVFIVWECELRKEDVLAQKLEIYLRNVKNKGSD